MIDYKTNIETAAKRSRPYVRHTPLEHSPYLSSLAEANVFLKLDNIQKTGSFKFRGAISKITSLNDKDIMINLYLNVYSGEITAVRSLQWRIWDLMWGFHIMDWQTRDKINNIFLQIFSILALVSSISGIMLFFRVDFNSK